MPVLPACHSALSVLRQVEPVIVLEELGSSLFDTALQMVVLARSATNTTDPDSQISASDSQQIAITNFYMIYNLILRFTPIIPAVLLARLGDRGWRRLPIIVPLVGYLVSRVALLLVVIFNFPIEVMYGAGALFGLSGGYTAYWPGVMALASLSSTASERSKAMMKVELLYGIAGLVGSLISGHLFMLYTSNLKHGVVLLIVSTLLALLCLLDAALLLQVKDVTNEEEEEETRGLIPPLAHNEVPIQKNMINVVLLFTAAILYSSAVGGAVEVLGSFVLKEPLSWNAQQVGYGNAAGCVIFITSYLGVIALRRYISETSLIMIGMLSFTSGIYFMSFVTATYMFYVARSLTLFALIPLPTMRSLLSQQVPKSSCGMTLTILQLALKFAALAYIPASTKIYQGTLDWFPGFVFMLSSVVSVLAMIPISIVGCRTQKKEPYETIQGD